MNWSRAIRGLVVSGVALAAIGGLDCGHWQMTRSATAQTLLERLERRLSEAAERNGADRTAPSTPAPSRSGAGTIERAARPERQAAAFVVARASLGTRVAALTDEARREFGVSARRGALVAEVEPEGAAAKAGLATGHVIVAADGRRIDSPQDLVEFIRSARPGQEVELTYYQGDQLRRKRVRLGESDSAAAPAADPLEEVPAVRRPTTTDRAPSGASAERAPPERGVPDRGGVERAPALKRLEKLIDGLSVRPADSPVPAPERASEARGDDSEVRAALSELRAEVADLRRRVRELEQRLERVGERPTTPRAAPAATEPDDRPGLSEPELEAPKNRSPQPKEDAPPNVEPNPPSP